MAYKFKKGEKVAVIAGKEKGKVGVISKVIRAEDKVLISDVNMVTKHMKPNAAYPKGGKFKMEKPLHISNILHVDPKLDCPTRIMFRVESDGTKVKVSKKSNEIIKPVE